MVGHKTLGAATVGVLLAGLGAAQLLPAGSSPLSSSPAQAGELIAYDGCGPLLQAYRDELARTATAYGWGNQGYGTVALADSAGSTSTSGGGTTGASAALPPGAERAAVPMPAGAVAGDAEGNGASGTNLQEKGVDEPDIVKLTGGHLVTVSGGSLRVISTGDAPTVLGRLAIPGQGNQSRSYYGGGSQELLVDGDRALVIDQGYRVTGKAPIPSGRSGTGSATSTTGQVVGPDTPVTPVTPLAPVAPDEPVSDTPGQVDPVAPVAPPVPADTPPDAGGSSSSEGSQGTTGSTSGAPAVDLPAQALPAPMPHPYPGSYDLTTPTTVLRLADLSDPAKPRWIETYQLDGSYLSARLVDGTVRLVTRSQPAPTPPAPIDLRPTNQRSYELQQQKQLAAIKAAAQTLTLAQVLPQATRTDGAGAQLDKGAAVQCADVSHAVDAAGGGLLLVTTLHPDDGLEPVDSHGVQADGDLVYATTDRLFVATSRWGTSSRGFARDVQASDEVTTQVHAFDTTKADDLRYVGTGSVDGYVYGRWALSWHRGSLRVATTTGQPWGGSGRTSSSSVVVLNGDLKEVGRVDGLGKGELIQAVRYLGDFATVVTFRQTDPLYVLDLSEPAAPRLTGQLKVPGFSTYLHPIGGDRLLGIGMEADAQTGRTTGMQASVFDLSDLGKPTQVDRLQLGPGHSEALQESRAFGYDPARRLAVLPFTGGQGTSSGLGITVGADGQLSLAGKLALEQPSVGGPSCKELVEPALACGYPGGPQVRRVVLDGDRVHVVTDSSVTTGTAKGFARTGSVSY